MDQQFYINIVLGIANVLCAVLFNNKLSWASWMAAGALFAFPAIQLLN